MAEIIYGDSAYKFTDPIRLYKANDPYYWEVDNLPLKQLQENSLWLKDQLVKAPFGIANVQRKDLAELKPYSDGVDRIVKVQPGRYTARINDAYTANQQPLQSLKKVLGDNLGDPNAFGALLMSSDTTEVLHQMSPYELYSVLTSVKDILDTDALGLNGLIERAFAYPTKDSANSILSEYTSSSVASIGKGTLVGEFRPPFPIAEALLYMYYDSPSNTEFLTLTYDVANEGAGFLHMPTLENALIKRWRGVGRLAMVDVPTTLEFDIPPLLAEDEFFYIDELGNKQAILGVNHRIDLLFIYSKPIDVSATTILKGGSKQVINAPILGIVKGAGLGLDFTKQTDPNAFAIGAGPKNAYDEEGNPIILACVGDQNNLQMGFAAENNELGFRGSFPVPDDLLNLAPALSEKLTGNEWDLVGQTILPIAYVVSRATTTVNTAGQSIISDDDVIDIRPFLRTAELSYNERTGIMGAYPPLSLANPAVGKAELDVEVRKTVQHVEGLIPDAASTGPRMISSGYVFGGRNFGVEGALMDFYKSGVSPSFSNLAGTDDTTLKKFILNKYKFGGALTPVDIPDYPQWDKAEWTKVDHESDDGVQLTDAESGITEGILDDVGRYPYDYMNTIAYGGERQPYFGVHDDKATSKAKKSKAKQVTQLGIDGSNFPPQQDFDGDAPYFNTHYCKKTIKFKSGLLPWLEDYVVNAQFINCIPMTYRGHPADQFEHAAGGCAGIWVEKGVDEFTIYVAWQAADHARHPSANYPQFAAPHSIDVTTFSKGKKKKKKKVKTTQVDLVERTGSRWVGFIVPVMDIIKTTDNEYYDNSPEVGMCIYPTIQWTLTLIPKTEAEFINGLLDDEGVYAAVNTGEVQ
jgi:hypothetical protein